jgi:hypothetical protein
MRRRNLLTSPPSYLGYDIPTWDAEGAFEDILIDCYVYAFVRRIKGLRKQFRTRTNIDGCITLNVDNFLTERQQRRDPIGYAVFGNVEAAASALACASVLAVSGLSHGRLRGESLLHLDPGQSCGSPCDPARLRGEVAEAVGWADALEALTSVTEAGGLWVEGFIRHLQTGGVGCVRVSDLVSAVAGRARDEWAAMHAVRSSEVAREADDELGAITRLVWPENGAENADVLEMLRRVVPARIAQEKQQRVRDRLAVVFREWLLMIEEGGVAHPDQNVLAGRLGMPDATLSDYLRRLRCLLTDILPDNPEG